MPLADMKSFFRWLDTATEEELIQRRDRVREALEKKLTESGAISDAEYLLKLIESELVSRL